MKHHGIMSDVAVFLTILVLFFLLIIWAAIEPINRPGQGPEQEKLGMIETEESIR